MATELETLLDAEAAVQQLLKEVRTLAGETTGYSEARTSLVAVQQDLSKHLAAVLTLTERAQAAIAGLKDIGTPEILQRMQVFREDLKSGIQGIETAVKAAGKDLEQHSGAAQVRLQQSVSETLATTAASLDKTLVKGQQSLAESIAAAQSANAAALESAKTTQAAAIAELGKRLDAAEAAAMKGRNLQTVLTMLLIGLVIVLGALQLPAVQRLLNGN